jgi:hypothetical protein
MTLVGFALLLVGFIWSVARGVQISMLCVVANFILPPISQAFFSIYEPVMRAPLAVMLAGLGILYMNGSISLSLGH